MCGHVAHLLDWLHRQIFTRGRWSSGSADIVTWQRVCGVRSATALMPPLTHCRCCVMSRSDGRHLVSVRPALTGQAMCCSAAAGAKGHHLAFSLQQMGSLGNNVAIQLSSALVMKAGAASMAVSGHATAAHRCPSLHLPFTTWVAPRELAASLKELVLNMFVFCYRTYTRHTTQMAMSAFTSGSSCLRESP